MDKTGWLLAFLLTMIYSTGFGRCGKVITGEQGVTDTECLGEKLLQRSLSGSKEKVVGFSGTSETLYEMVLLEDGETVAALRGEKLESNDTLPIKAINACEVAEVPEAYPGYEDCGLIFYPRATHSGQSIEYWSKVSGPGSVTFYPNEYQPVLDSMVVEMPGTYEVAWNISDGTCTSDTVVTYIAKESPVANAGVDSNICGTTYSLNAEYSLSGATGKWTKVSGGLLNFTNDTSPITEVNSQPGTFQLSWEETYNGCSDDATVTIEVAEQPEADAGSDIAKCDTVIQLSASQDLGTGTWVGPGFISFDNVNSGSATATAHQYANSVQLFWVVTNSFCSDTDTVMTSFYEQPVANALVPDDVCGRTAELMGSPSIENSQKYWAAVTGDFTLTPVNDSMTTAYLNTEVYREYTFRWKEINGICSDSTDVTLKYTEQPIADPGDGGEECDLDFTLSGTQSVGQGQWSYTGAGTLSFFPDSLSPNAQIETNAYGTYTLNWKETNDKCSDDSSITIVFSEQPHAQAYSGGDTCGFTYRLTTIKSIASSVGSWEQLSGPSTTVNFYAKDSTHWEANVDTQGEYRFKWMEKNGTCTDDTALTVSYTEMPKASINTSLTDTLICGNNAVLYAQSTIGTGIWEETSTNGDIEFASDDSFETSVEVGHYGSYTVSWSVTNQNCSSADTISLEFLEQPEAYAGEDQHLDNVFEAKLEATLDTGMTGEWALLSGSGDIEKENSPETNVYNMELGKNVFQWTASNQGECTDKDTVSVFVYDIFIPELLTPNGDGDNDVFEIKGISTVESAALTVFNRWGGKVFYSAHYENNWKGTNKSGQNLTNDTYFYVLNINKGQRIFKGFIILSR